MKISYLLKSVEKKGYDNETIEILSDKPTVKILTLLEGKSTYQIETASRILEALFMEQEKKS